MPPLVRYRVTGMDCAADAAEIEKAARLIEGVETVKVSTASQIMTVGIAKPVDCLPKIEGAVTALGYRLDRLRDSAARTGADELRAPNQLPTDYTRALWVVVLLNAGYGVVEMAGGFLSGSQALKADALDFLGDGVITFLGLLAVGWSLLWRARSALVQGLFLGFLGMSVLAATVYRVLVQQRPEADLMGVFGLVALAVNVVAAVVLIPHRTGDANARAVWLFSRNDAIGNAAVVAAAGLVAWTGRAWPDLVVAVVIAGLFLHSAWSIVRDALGDLREAAASRQGA